MMNFKYLFLLQRTLDKRKIINKKCFRIFLGKIKKLLSFSCFLTLKKIKEDIPPDAGFKHVLISFCWDFMVTVKIF